MEVFGWPRILGAMFSSAVSSCYGYPRQNLSEYVGQTKCCLKKDSYWWNLPWSQAWSVGEHVVVRPCSWFLLCSTWKGDIGMKPFRHSHRGPVLCGSSGSQVRGLNGLIPCCWSWLLGQGNYLFDIVQVVERYCLDIVELTSTPHSLGFGSSCLERGCSFFSRGCPRSEVGNRWGLSKSSLALS